jgi:hypothetical protein
MMMTMMMMMMMMSECHGDDNDDDDDVYEGGRRSPTHAHPLSPLQKNGWTVAVPRAYTLRGVSVSREFVEQHVLRPLAEPGAFATCHRRSAKDEQVLRLSSLLLIAHHASQRVVRKDSVLCTAGGFQEARECRITAVETHYSDDFSPYQVIVISHPLVGAYNRDPEARILDGSNALLDLAGPHSERIEHGLAAKFLLAYAENKSALLRCTEQIALFQRSFFIVDSMQDVVAAKLKGIAGRLVSDLYQDNPRLQSLARSEERVAATILRAAECFVMGNVRERVFPSFSAFMAPRLGRFRENLRLLAHLAPTGA